MDSLTTFAEAVFDAVRKIPGASKLYTEEEFPKVACWNDAIYEVISSTAAKIYNTVIKEVQR